MTSPEITHDAATIYLGNCLDVLRDMPDDSVDSIVTDPPYGLSNTDPAHVVEALTKWATGDRTFVPTGRGFMGKSWDAFVPPPAVWDECFRVLKPGGHLLAFAGSRTFDLMTLSIRFAGFDIRDGIAWLYGSGFPKSLDVSKAIDKARDDRHSEALTVTVPMADAMRAKGLTRRDLNRAAGLGDNDAGSAANWTTTVADRALKPRVPTVEQWAALRDLLGLTHLDAEVRRLNGHKGTPGDAFNLREVIASREVQDIRNGHGREYGGAMFAGQEAGKIEHKVTAPATPAAQQWQGWGTALKPAFEPIVVARKPLIGTVAANVLAHGTGALNIDGTRVGTDGGTRLAEVTAKGDGIYEGGINTGAFGTPVAGLGRWPANVVLDGDAADALDEQSGTLKSGKLEAHHTRNPKDAGILGAYESAQGERGYGDSGGASRFFPTFRYQAKAPTRERPAVVAEDGTRTAHPTVKPLALMRWLVRLVTPPGGVVLDPFVGSGTTVEAAALEGFQAVGIEGEADYLPLIQQRLDRLPTE